jgi:hypothetical protein
VTGTYGNALAEFQLTVNGGSQEFNKGVDCDPKASARDACPADGGPAVGR